MRHWRVSVSIFALCMIVGGLYPAGAGDSLLGTVRDVKSADLVTLDYGTGSYPVRLIGIEVPREGPIAQQARDFVVRLVQGKQARMRFEGRNEQGEMVSILLTADAQAGIKNVNLELVRAGLARRQKGYDFKYGELAAAEREAQEKKLGIWATGQPQ